MRRLWIVGLLLTFVACREKAPPEGAVRVTVNYGSYRPACLRVVARDAQGQEGRTDILQDQFKDPDGRRILVAVFRKAEWSREVTLEVSSFERSEGEACSGNPVEQLSSELIPVPPGDFAEFAATLRAKDDDGDSFIAKEEGVAGMDCDDGRAEVYPGAAERCSVQVDYDCNGVKGCQDSRCQQSACDDGNLCTTGDKCEGSGASAQCKGQAVQCEKPAGACVLGATCAQETGQCVVTRKQCGPPPNTCREAGVCNDATGSCDFPPKEASVSCDDTDACTTGDECNGAGTCQGTQTPCTPSSICFRVASGCTALGNCAYAPDPSKVNATCALKDGSANGVCRVADGECSRFPYIPSNFDPDTVPTASILPLTTTCDVTFDSTTLSWNSTTCVSNPPTPIELKQGDGMVLFALSELKLGGNLRLVGNRPVILAVYGSANLEYQILANALGTTPGAGGSLPSACADRRGKGGLFSSTSVGGGGGGAGGATVGALGGNGTGSGSDRGEGGSAGGNVFVPLVGGCPGGSGGGGGGAEAQGGMGGAGGGAVQLSVAGTLTVNQRVSASAGGGRGGQHSTSNDGQAGGGGGGGSGGQVLIEAYQLNLGSSCRLTANGGGGGEGSGYHPSTKSNGRAGGDGRVESATGGAGGGGDSPSGGDGGNGGDLDEVPAIGNQGIVNSGSKGGGGGGGGAVGHIRLRSVRPCSINGATIISPATNTQCPL